MISVLIADDHPIVRQGIRELIEDESDLTVIGEASSGLETIRLSCELQPTVLVLDIMMDDINGIEVARQVKQKCPRTAIVVLSMHGDKKHIIQALKTGVNAYVIKKSVSSELLHAVREAVAGRRYLGTSISDVVVEAYLEKVEADPLVNPIDLLSSREREVLHMAAHGHTNAEIAEHLCLSRRTVETHRANAMRKLNLETQTELIRYALQEGILASDNN